MSSWCATKRWKDLTRSLKGITASDLKVLYKRDGLLAISKPYGLAVHEGPGLAKTVLGMGKDLQELHDLADAPRLVHRLDKYSSGLLLLAYTEEMAKKLSDLFKERKINKTYYGVTVGIPQSSNGILDDPICEAIVGEGKIHRMVTRTDLQEKSSVFPMPHSQLKRAYTAYKVLDINQNTCALIEFVTKTGIKHQIRLHSASSLGCPILGDHKFSSFSTGPQVLPLRLMQLLQIQAIKPKDPTKKGHIQLWQRALIPLHLFAKSIEIPDVGIGGKTLNIKAPLPEFFSETLHKCNLHPKRQAMMERDERRYRHGS